MHVYMCVCVHDVCVCVCVCVECMYVCMSVYLDVIHMCVRYVCALSQVMHIHVVRCGEYLSHKQHLSRNKRSINCHYSHEHTHS